MRAAIYGLLPHKLVFAFRGEALPAASDHDGIDDVTEAYGAVGIWIEPMLESNRDKIARPPDVAEPAENQDQRAQAEPGAARLREQVTSFAALSAEGAASV